MPVKQDTVDVSFQDNLHVALCKKSGGGAIKQGITLMGMDN